MTVLATMIGCSFLIVLASIGFGIQETMRNEILNQEQITQIELWGNETLSDEDKTFIEKIEHVNVVLKRKVLMGIFTQNLKTEKEILTVYSLIWLLKRNFQQI